MRAYSFDTKQLGQVPAGGDSGGPDILIGQNGVPMGIIGVHSNCGTTQVPGKPAKGWDWVSSIDSCESAAIGDIRDQIVAAVSRKAPARSTDFDNDHRADILWHNDTTGETQIWFMSGTARIGRATAASVAPR